MAVIKSFCGGSDPDWDQEPFCVATHPPCEHQDAINCEPCRELTEIEAQIEDLHSRLKDLHEQHRQARTRRNHIHSSIIRLFPLEILTYIFTLAFPTREKPPCCPSLETQRIPLVIAAVCQPWRVLALSIPKLWSDLDVDANKPNFPLLAHQIAYSGTIPLSIYLFAQVAVCTPHLPQAKQAMSFVLKQLHRTSSFYLDIVQGSTYTGVFCNLPDADYPKAAPLLQEIHIHWCPNTDTEQFRFAIEPPSPQSVVSGSDDILLDWTSVSNVELLDFHLPPPFLASSVKDLKRLDLAFSSDDDTEIPEEPSPLIVIRESIKDLVLRSDTATFLIFATTTLPSLQALVIYADAMHMHISIPLFCAFLRRSLCPLEVLSLDVKHCATGDITALAAVLEITDLVQRLTLQLHGSLSLPSSIEPLLHRFNSDSRFLPRLQSLDLEMNRQLPPFGLLLDLMLDRPPSCEHGFASPIHRRRPLDELKLDFHIQNRTMHRIPQDDLCRISQLRAAGKAISITSLFILPDGRAEVVEY